MQRAVGECRSWLAPPLLARKARLEGPPLAVYNGVDPRESVCRSHFPRCRSDFKVSCVDTLVNFLCFQTLMRVVPGWLEAVFINGTQWVTLRHLGAGWLSIKISTGRSG